MGVGLVIMDDDGNGVELDRYEAECLFSLANHFEDATVSACPDCKSRVVSSVALVDVIVAAPPHPRSSEIFDLADDAPTLHLYMIDEAADCGHPNWHDPLFDEWLDAVEEPGTHARR
jgi:hypothetical protein